MLSVGRFPCSFLHLLLLPHPRRQIRVWVAPRLHSYTLIFVYDCNINALWHYLSLTVVTFCIFIARIGVSQHTPYMGLVTEIMTVHVLILIRNCISNSEEISIFSWECIPVVLNHCLLKFTEVSQFRISHPGQPLESQLTMYRESHVNHRKISMVQVSFQPVRILLFETLQDDGIKYVDMRISPLCIY